VFVSPSPEVVESPVRLTRICSGSDPAGPLTPEFAFPPRPAIALPVRDTRTREPPEKAGNAAHTAIPTAATPANAEAAVAILLAVSHRKAVSATARPATTTHVPVSTARRTFM
jgi:hypothetical protein